MMYPYVAIAYVNNHCISWHEIGTCLTCAKCTDVNIDWDGTPYMCWGDNCGGADNFTCKRYKLNPNIKFFKYMDIKSTSPDSELKRYIEESIKNSHKDNEPDSNEPPFMSEVCKSFIKDPDSLLKAFSDVCGVKFNKEDPDKMISELHEVNDTISKTSGLRNVDYGIPVIYPNFDGVYPDFDGDILPKEDNNES